MRSIRIWHLILGVCVLLLASLACAQMEVLPTVEATEAPVVEASPTTDAGEMLLEEQFVDNSNNWAVGENKYTKTSIEDGKYQVRVPTDGYNWFNGPVAVSDVDITVDTEFVEGEAANSDYGVICRLVDAENHYRFRIASDGVYRIDKLEKGEFIALVDWTPSDALKIGTGVVNTMRVICNRNHLTLYVNDTLLADVVDSSFEGGSFALMVGAYTNTDTNVVTPAVVNFSNLTVRKPLP